MVDEKKSDRVRIDIMDMTELSVWLSEYLNNDSCNVIIIASKELIKLANEDEELRDVIETADMILPGANVKLDEIEYDNGSEVRLESEYLEIESITAVDKDIENANIDTEVVEELSKSIRKDEVSLFVLNDKESNMDALIKKLEYEFPKVKYQGNCLVDEDTKEDNVINEINVVSPDILCCVLKTPFQERWIMKNKNKINAKLCILIGGEYNDVLVKKNKNANWITKLGLNKIYEKLFLE